MTWFSRTALSGHAELVLAQVNPRRPAAVGAPGPGPLTRVVAVHVDVPVRAAGVPDAVGEGRSELAVEGVGGLPADLDPTRVGPAQLVEGADHVAHPRLDRV